MDNLWYLKEREFFTGYEAQKTLFLERAACKTYQKGDIIFHEGDVGDSCFYVVSGLVRIFSMADSGKESVFFLRRAGEIFGLSEVFNHFPRRASAQALMPTTLSIMSSTDLDVLLAEDYVLARRCITMLGSRVRYLCDRINDLMTSRVMNRLINLFISLVYEQLCDTEAWSTPVGLPVCISQEQLAALIGSTQPTVNALLQKLQEEGVISMENRCITVLNPLQMLMRAKEIA